MDSYGKLWTRHFVQNRPWVLALYRGEKRVYTSFFYVLDVLAEIFTLTDSGVVRILVMGFLSITGTEQVDHRSSGDESAVLSLAKTRPKPVQNRNEIGQNVGYIVVFQSLQVVVKTFGFWTKGGLS